MNFNEINVRREIVTALNESGICTPTTIQEKVIPLIMDGKDVIGISKTGSGKTAAFAIPILEKESIEKHIQTLIVVPTRELAVQISKEIRKFGRYLNCCVTAVYGGVSIYNQIQDIKKSNIVVGTPGRLLDHINRGTMDLSRLNFVILDEADKMVSMGFIEDIELILNNTPKNRITLLFGATISNEIDALKRKYMKNPVIVKTEQHVQEAFLEQFYYNVDHRNKFSLLVHLLKKERMHKIIVFCSTRSTVEVIARNLRLNGINADMIHGKLSQNRRLKVIENFNRGATNILIASSVAARGLDIKCISHVINYDLSKDPQEYVHRIGRTARAGERGRAITLISDRDHENIRNVLSRYDVKVHLLPQEDFPRLSLYINTKGNGHFAGRGRMQRARHYGSFNGNSDNFKRGYSHNTAHAHRPSFR